MKITNDFIRNAISWQRPTILISRTDNIGDVILTLPICGIIKQHIPNSKIIFLCSRLCRPLVEKSIHVNQCVLWHANVQKIPRADIILHVFPIKKIARLAYVAGIPMRIATNRRWYHWYYCNVLVNLTRKNSNEHEAKLNLKLLQPLSISKKYTTKKLWLYNGWKIKPIKKATKLQRRKLIFHIKSRGSAKEWPTKYYEQLAQMLPAEHYQIYITGTQSEGVAIRREAPNLLKLKHVHEVTGRFTLSQLIDFIGNVEALIAASTGPLHIAATLGIQCFALFSNQRPIHPQRWQPIGPRVHVITDVSNTKHAYLEIPVQKIYRRLIQTHPINMYPNSLLDGLI